MLLRWCSTPAAPTSKVFTRSSSTYLSLAKIDNKNNLKIIFGIRRVIKVLKFGKIVYLSIFRQESIKNPTPRE